MTSQGVSVDWSQFYLINCTWLVRSLEKIKAILWTLLSNPSQNSIQEIGILNQPTFSSWTTQIWISHSFTNGKTKRFSNIPTAQLPTPLTQPYYAWNFARLAMICTFIGQNWIKNTARLRSSYTFLFFTYLYLSI